MKRFPTLILICFIIFQVSAQRKALTMEGDTVLLYNDGTWVYENWQSPEMVFIEDGSFIMGSDLEGVDEDELPAHLVTLSSYHIGKYEVTVKQYREFCDDTGHPMPEIPSWGWTDDFPIVNVTWYDAHEYCKWVCEKTGKNYHLPSEAQWEYAARGAGKSKGYVFSGGNKIHTVAWFSENTKQEGPQCVGTKKANEMGIFDMCGNVAEWCNDFYDKDYYSKSPVNDPKGPITGTHKIVRGGSWKEEAWKCRPAFRYINTEIIWYNFMGFRLAMEDQ